MSGTRASTTPESGAPGGGAAFALVVSAIVMAGALLALVLVALRSAEPVVLTIVAFLSMLGVFFLFGLAAGHIRFLDRVEPAVLLKSTVDSIDGGIMVTARDGSVLMSNREWRALVGADADGNARDLDSAFSAELLAAECLFRLVRAAERGEVRSEEFRVRDSSTPNRAARWLRLTVKPVAGLGMPDSGMTMWQLTDVSGEKAREAESVRSLESSLTHYERASAGLLAASPEGRVLHINAVLAGWLGLDAEAVRSRNLTLSDLIAGSGEALLRTSLNRSRPEPVRVEVDLVREDGVGLPVELILPGSGPAPADAISALVLPRSLSGDDANGKTSAEARFARLFQSAPFGIATLAEDGRILSSNAAFAKMFLDAGITEADSIGRLLSVCGDELSRRATEAAITDARAGRASLEPIEITFGPDRQFTRRLYVSPIARALRQGEIAMLYAIDATEQKALELKYAQSTKMEAVGKLAGGIAHDFNNVLTAIIGFSDLLLQTHRPTDAAFKDIINIKQNANRAAGLVRQLLAFSRRQTLTPETLELNERLTDLSVMLNRLIGEQVDLKITSGRDLWYVKADGTQFDQVIINLAVNAKDAMPNGGKLTIRTKNISERDSLKLRAQSVVAGEYVMVEVEDTGTGMTPEVMTKIFEPFFSTKEVGKGTGLGLSTVYGIVKQTGGYVFPESTPGKGTTFRVYLPRFIPEEKTEAETASAKEAKKEKDRPRDLTGSGRVLLVEDEDSVRSFAVRALKRQGYEVLEATTGAEALEVFEREEGRIDIVVSDVVMPEMDGPTMLTELRKTNPELRVIFVSGYPDDRFKSGMKPNEQFAFLPKPFTLPQLAAKVKEELAK